jgi:hypothetical protein
MHPSSHWCSPQLVEVVPIGWWLDAPGLASVLLIVNGLNWCWLRMLHASLLRVIYRKYASMRYQHKCNTWGAKSGILYAHARLNHISLQAIY